MSKRKHVPEAHGGLAAVVDAFLGQLPEVIKAEGPGTARASLAELDRAFATLQKMRKQMRKEVQNEPTTVAGAVMLTSQSECHTDSDVEGGTLSVGDSRVMAGQCHMHVEEKDRFHPTSNAAISVRAAVYFGTDEDALVTATSDHGGQVQIAWNNEQGMEPVLLAVADAAYLSPVQFDLADRQTLGAHLLFHILAAAAMPREGTPNCNDGARAIMLAIEKAYPRRADNN